MHLFESAWQDGFESYERVFDTHSNTSKKFKIDRSCEFFIPKSSGLYSYVLDQSIKLDKQFGTSKAGKGQFGFCRPIAGHIRDTYWNEDQSKSTYNQNPRMWYIDIETRVGISYKYTISDTLVKIRVNDKELDTTSDKLRARFYDDSTHSAIEYYNTELLKWESLSLSPYLARNSGFPVPEKALEEISMFQIYDSIDDTIYLFGTRDWVHQYDYLKYGDTAKYLDEFRVNSTLQFNVKYIKSESEREMIDKFLKFFSEKDPLILLAWNGLGFDYPYIYNRLKNLGIDTNKLSNYGKVTYSESEFKGMKEFSVNSSGHYFLDLKEIYKKFSFNNHTNFSLDTVANDLLKDSKIKHTEYTKFDDFYTGNYNIPDKPSDEQLKTRIYHSAKNNEKTSELSHSEFVWYGLKDTLLLKRINDRVKLTNVLLDLASRTGTQLPDTLGTVKMWGQFLSNLLMSQGLVMPKQSVFEDPNVVGGYVKDPKIGRQDWVLSVDVNSMYPLLGMVSFNMSPETFITKDKLPPAVRDIILSCYNDQNEERLLKMNPLIKEEMSKKLKEHNISLGINGACFSQNAQGIIPRTVEQIYNERKRKKKEMFKYEQLRIKIEQIQLKKSSADKSVKT